MISACFCFSDIMIMILMKIKSVIHVAAQTYQLTNCWRQCNCNSRICIWYSSKAQFNPWIMCRISQWSRFLQKFTTARGVVSSLKTKHLNLLLVQYIFYHLVFFSIVIVLNTQMANSPIRQSVPFIFHRLWPVVLWPEVHWHCCNGHYAVKTKSDIAYMWPVTVLLNFNKWCE